MQEWYRRKIIVGEKTIENRDMNTFFDEKASQSDIVNGWSEIRFYDEAIAHIANQ